MADKELGALSPIEALLAAALFHTVQQGNSRKVTAQQIADFVNRNYPAFIQTLLSAQDADDVYAAIGAAPDANKLGGQLPSFFASAEAVSLALQDLSDALAGKVPNSRTVAGKPLTDNVTLAKADVGLGNVTNTSDANKPVSTAQQAALDLKVAGPNGGVSAGQVAGFGTTTGKEIVGLTSAEVRSFAAVPISNFRNKIMNALGALNTRNVSGTVTLAAGAFGHDRMKAGASGCTYTFATSNGVTTFTITAGSFQHTIESRAFAGQAGRYWLSWSGTAQGRINGGSYGASGTVFADLDASANVTVEFGTGTLNLPQLELDYVSAFSGRPQDIEEMLCRRYLPGIRSDGAGTIPTFGFAVNASSAVFTVPFPVRSRLKPTGLVVAGSASFTTFASDQAVTGWTFGGQTSEVAGEVSISTSGSGYTPSHAGWLRASGGALNIYFTGADL